MMSNNATGLTVRGSTAGTGDVQTGCGQWRTDWGGVGVFNLPTEIPKTVQNRAKLNPIVKTVTNF